MNEIYEALDIDTVTVGACEVGSYAWLKLGFVPGDIESFKERVIVNMDANLVSPWDREIVLGILQSSDPKIAWVIADLESFISEPGSLKLGQLLTIGTNWGGKLDRKDPESMERFNAYCQEKLAEKGLA